MTHRGSFSWETMTSISPIPKGSQASLIQRARGELAFDYGSMRNEKRLDHVNNLQLGGARRASSRLHVRGREAEVTSRPSEAGYEIDGSRARSCSLRDRRARSFSPPRTKLERREISRIAIDQKGAFDKIHALIKRTVAMKVWHHHCTEPEVAGESISVKRPASPVHIDTKVRPHAGSADLHRSNSNRKQATKLPRVSVSISGANGLLPIFRIDPLPGDVMPDTYCVCGIPGRPTEDVYTTQVAKSTVAPRWSNQFGVSLAPKENLSFTVYEVYDPVIGIDPSNDVPLGIATMHSDSDYNFSGQLQLWQGDLFPRTNLAGQVQVTVSFLCDGDGVSDSDEDEAEVAPDHFDTYDMRRISLRPMQGDAHIPVAVETLTPNAPEVTGKPRRRALQYRGTMAAVHPSHNTPHTPNDSGALAKSLKRRRRSSTGGGSKWDTLRITVKAAAALQSAG